ncbi:hypothetical protein PSPO01_00763 [Paraphaeosphaeria sporulosa]
MTTRIMRVARDREREGERKQQCNARGTVAKGLGGRDGRSRPYGWAEGRAGGAQLGSRWLFRCQGYRREFTGPDRDSKVAQRLFRTIDVAAPAWLAMIRPVKETSSDFGASLGRRERWIPEDDRKERGHRIVLTSAHLGKDARGNRASTGRVFFLAPRSSPQQTRLASSARYGNSDLTRLMRLALVQATIERGSRVGHGQASRNCAGTRGSQRYDLVHTPPPIDEASASQDIQACSVHLRRSPTPPETLSRP